MLKRVSNNAWFGLMILAGAGFEAVALTYQYALDYGPCPLCIHVRIGVFGFMLVSAFALWANRLLAWRIGHLFNAGLLAWLSERAYLLLGTERGFVYLECGIESGLPVWLALDKWLPLLFEVKESCGYTPKLLFGVSMAEALIVVFPLMLVITLLLLLRTFLSSQMRQ